MFPRRIRRLLRRRRRHDTSRQREHTQQRQKTLGHAPSLAAKPNSGKEPGEWAPPTQPPTSQPALFPPHSVPRQIAARRTSLYGSGRLRERLTAEPQRPQRSERAEIWVARTPTLCVVGETEFGAHRSPPKLPSDLCALCGSAVQIPGAALHAQGRSAHLLSTPSDPPKLPSDLCALCGSAVQIQGDALSALARCRRARFVRKGERIVAGTVGAVRCVAGSRAPTLSKCRNDVPPG